MKKNININLFGTLYAIDEDACELLEDYLNNMKSYFAKREGGDEIADDIEHRVAEHLWALKEQGMNAIDLETVKRIIGSIGNPDEVDGSTNDDSAESAGDSTTETDDSATETGDSATEKTAKERDAETDDKHRNGKHEIRVDINLGDAKWIDRMLHHIKTHRFYRDGKDKIAGGVISGLRHYCGGGDIVVWRVCAVLLALATFTLYQMNFSGGMQRFLVLFFTVPLIIYVALWLLAPVARTAEERLCMTGVEVTPESISRTLIAEADKEKKPTTRRHGDGMIMSRLFEIAKFGVKATAIVAFAIMSAVALAYLVCGVVYSIVGEPFLLLFFDEPENTRVLSSIPLLGMYWVTSAVCWLIVALLPLLGIARSFKPNRKRLGFAAIASLASVWTVAITMGILLLVLFAIHADKESKIIDRQQNTRNGIYLNRWTWEHLYATGWSVKEADNIRFASLFGSSDEDPLRLDVEPFSVSPDKDGKPMTLSLSRKLSVAKGDYALECMAICTAMDASLSVWSGSKCLAVLRLDGYGAAEDRILKDFDWTASRDIPLFSEQNDSTMWVDNVRQGNDKWHYLVSKPFHHDGGTLEYRLRIGQHNVEDATTVNSEVWMAHETLRKQ